MNIHETWSSEYPSTYVQNMWTEVASCGSQCVPCEFQLVRGFGGRDTLLSSCWSPGIFRCLTYSLYKKKKKKKEVKQKHTTANFKAVLTNLRVGVSPLCAALQVTPIIFTRTNRRRLSTVTRMMQTQHLKIRGRRLSSAMKPAFENILPF